MVACAKLIAIIEDDAVLRRGLKHFFEKQHCDVIDFEDGAEASKEIQNSKPDMIFCDFNLPGANGLEVLKTLRGAGNKIPFVLITGYYSDELAEDAKRNGATATLEKPFELEYLRRFVRT